MASSPRRTVILDTSAFVAGFDPFSIGEEQYTVPLVKEELDKTSALRAKLELAEESGKVKIKTPQEPFLNEAKASAKTVGDTFFLSATDHQVLALALELRNGGCSPLIATDDYSIQNVAKQLGIEFAPLITFGIRRRLQWIRYCPACHERYPADYGSRTCRVCGTELKRKPLKNQPP